ncbi:MAG TPA: ATP-binding protein, partial [Candidatus Thermoplasmatota archaeon]|nr:ATP-binding protein [Candidatus Thermoplasmatota archaeon]
GGTVKVRGAAAPTSIEVAVRDSGRGLEPDEMARLFRPFSQVHAPGEAPERGVGLGLYISKGIVEAHGGRIRAESEGRGKGTAFLFEIPLRGPAA